MRKVVNEAYVMPDGIKVGNYKGCNLLSNNIKTLIPRGGLMTTLSMRT